MPADTYITIFIYTVCFLYTQTTCKQQFSDMKDAAFRRSLSTSLQIHIQVNKYILCKVCTHKRHIYNYYRTWRISQLVGHFLGAFRYIYNYVYIYCVHLVHAIDIYVIIMIMYISKDIYMYISKEIYIIIVSIYISGV